MGAADDAVGDAIAALVPATLAALRRLEHAARHFDPATLEEAIAALADAATAPEAALAASRALDWPDALAPVRACLEDAAEAVATGLAAFCAAAEAPQPAPAAGRALRSYARGCAAIYPLCPFLPAVSDFFLEDAALGDAAVAARIARITPGRDGVGVMHLGGPPGTRGGYALYVPEDADPAEPLPLVVALHGGSGNGGAFLWTWLREARTSRCILLAPTATGPTWSLADPARDGAAIAAMVAEVAARWRIDPTRRLLTGMSDGGTFAYLLGLGAGTGFTHLAPVAAAFSPFVMAFADAERLRGLPVFVVHGARDWMFPAAWAREAAQVLRAAGAKVQHREIADCAHAYPREVNADVLGWFLGKATGRG